jgi:hypothetical protein
MKNRRGLQTNSWIVIHGGKPQTHQKAHRYQISATLARAAA